ncbi:MAG: DUF3179 domain-containing protein [Candidatus Tectomicrobia bacterium]|uniref:DUF3179 domain-containing protein n=1 Tax=Tectimicrobiota bacterium TaxID=2528274 RepID=A0A932I4D9_UNCTE|nr:DUF3179 domain-containing protein [Candidatus Tectomicrobia bacterium]
MYDRTLDDRKLTFGVSGKLWKNVLVMYDRQTGSLWSHLTGEAVVGPLTGQRLKTYPAAMMTWSEWRSLHPQTLVLEKPAGGRGMRDPYEDYYYSARTGIIPEKHRDSRLHPKTWIVGLVLDGRAKAYPFPALDRTGVLNDRFGGRELAVTYCKEARSGAVFDRHLEEKTLTFGPDPAEEASCRFMRDKETGSRWQRLTGAAVEGPMKGRRLAQLTSTQSFWFGWKDYYPKSEVFSAESSK